ncbi:HET-domain-containing protein [Hypoxylon rubiginosum]|uniref:HET-domain-containing protein n=1 Tax=Hypoxylon rubiginosum TaxID=110542 RepID=A0ACC0DFB7_9PEZI|nr:HET-domain-containing protein [Hypoxylon rubiginosum]
MFRWHRQTCRKPDICVADDVVFCSSCDSFAESPSIQSHCSSALFKRTNQSTSSLNLRWPLSVSYSSEGVAESNTPRDDTDTSAYQYRKRGLESARSSDDVSHTSHHPLDGRFYPPLSQKYDIRLLRFRHLQHGNCLHGELDSVDLVFCPSFEAISYTWLDEEGGDNTKTRSIFIGPFWDIIPITANCDSALRLFLSKGHRRVWIDSVCINQQDPHERTHQVSIMREIYSKASQVLVYLGLAANYSDEAMEVLREVLRKGDQPNRQLNSAEISGLTHLFDRRYFFRVWVIQEIAMAKRVTLYCGDNSISLPSFTTLRLPPRYIHRVSWLFKYGQGGTSPLTQPDELLHLLNTTSGCAASDARDHIFAVLGLIRDGIFEGLVPDYMLSTEQIYIGVASYLITRHKKTQILLYPKLRSGPHTWIPDWSIYRAPETVDKDGHYHTYPVDKEQSVQKVLQYISSNARAEITSIYDNPSVELEDWHIVWFDANKTTWTFFTTGPRDNQPRVQPFQRRAYPEISEDIFEQQPNVSALTGTLNIQCSVLGLESYRTISPREFARAIHFPGLPNNSEWVIKTEAPAKAEMDVLVNIPGCHSYLHLRKIPDGSYYNLLGTCRLGIRQEPTRTLKWRVEENRNITTLSSLRPNGSSVKLNMHHLWVSYIVGGLFLTYLDALLRSRLGNFLVAVFQARGENLGGLGNFDDLPLGPSEIWKLSSGWKTVNDDNGTANTIGTEAEQLKFWTRSATWQILNAIDVCVNSISDLEIAWSDWNRNTGDLAAREASNQLDMISGDLHDPYNTRTGDPNTTQTHSLSQYDTPLRSLFELVSLTKNLMQQLESESDTLILETVDEKGIESESKITRCAELRELYKSFIALESQAPKHNIPNTPISFEREQFENMIEFRIAILKWLEPSWKLFGTTGFKEFRHACQLISTIDDFHAGISVSQTIAIV